MDFDILAVNDMADPIKYMMALDAVYQSNKDKKDAELLDAIQKEISNIEAAVDTTGDVEARAARNKEFLIACGKFHNGKSKGNLNKVIQLATAGIDIDAIDEDGWSGLFHASGEGYFKIVNWLLENNAQIDLKDHCNCTPLWVAAFNNHRDVVKLLLLFGADETTQGQPEDEPLQTPSLAARRNRHPGLADYIDGESTLRRSDPDRRRRQLDKEMTVDEFNSSVKALLEPKK